MHPRSGEIRQLCYDPIRIGEETVLHTSLEGCYCGEVFSCEVSFASDGALELNVTVCDSELLCDGCLVGEVDCVLPGLMPGSWPIRQGSRMLGVVEIGFDEPGPSAVRECLTTAPAVDSSLFCDNPGHPAAVDQVCYDGISFGQLRTLQLTESCAGCFARGGQCEATVAGDEIRLQPSMRACDCPTCGACGPGCFAQTVDCTLPAEIIDGRYRLTVGDRSFGEIELTSGEGWCAGITSPGP